MVFRYPAGPERSTTSSAWSACRATRSRTANKRLTINGKPVPSSSRCPTIFDEDAMRYFQAVRREARRQRAPHPERSTSAPPFVPARSTTFPYRENCRYSAKASTCKVPPGHYFMMGDNRDNSQRQPLLGLRAGREHRRQGVLHLDELRQPEAHRLVPMTIGRQSREEHEGMTIESQAGAAARRHAVRAAVRGRSSSASSRWSACRCCRPCIEYFRRSRRRSTRSRRGRQHGARDPRRPSSKPTDIEYIDPVDQRQGPGHHQGRTTRSSISFAYDKEIQLIGPVYPAASSTRALEVRRDAIQRSTTHGCRLDALQQRLGHRFADPRLLRAGADAPQLRRRPQRAPRIPRRRGAQLAVSQPAVRALRAAATKATCRACAPTWSSEDTPAPAWRSTLGLPERAAPGRRRGARRRRAARRRSWPMRSRR